MSWEGEGLVHYFAFFMCTEIDKRERVEMGGEDMAWTVDGISFYFLGWR